MGIQNIELELSERYKKILKQEEELNKNKEDILNQMAALNVTSGKMRGVFRIMYYERYITNNERFNECVYAELDQMADKVEDVSVAYYPELTTETSLKQLRGHYGLIPVKSSIARHTVLQTIYRLIEKAMFNTQLKLLHEETNEKGPLPLDTQIGSYYISRRIINAFKQNGFKGNGRTLGEFMDFYRQVVVNARLVGEKVNQDVSDFLSACGYEVILCQRPDGSVEVVYNRKVKTSTVLTKENTNNG